MSKNLWKSPRIVPSLAYEDVPAALEWLSRAFGFRERRVARLTGQGFVLAWMELGDGLISLSTAGGHNVHSPKSAGKATQSLKVYVDDIDRHFERAKAAGAKIISEPRMGSGAGASIALRIPRGTIGSSHRSAAIWPRRTGSCRKGCSAASATTAGEGRPCQGAGVVGLWFSG